MMKAKRFVFIPECQQIKLRAKRDLASRWLAMKTFSVEDRLALYEDLAFLLENNLKTEDALQSMIASQRNKYSAQALCLQEMLKALKQGSSPDRGLEGWVPLQEMILIQAGNQDGDLASAFKRAMKIARANGEMRSACYSSLSYPFLLFISSLVMMYMVESRFLPRLASLVPAEQWTGALWWLSTISAMLINHLVIIGAVLFSLTIGIYWSLPNLTGESRRRVLDMLLPWSLYRDIQGIAFLLNFTALMRAQIKTQDALLLFSRQASPWLFERLTASLMQIRQGKQLGHAFRDSGYMFPSPQAIDRLILLSSGDRSERIIENYGYYWLEKTVVRIKRMASRLSYTALGINASYMALILLSTQDLNGLIANH
ncbi:type II secretion system F family protein [Erwinia pyrifoliae]|uniref:Type II secretion system F family protein n=1 Tax=Erwinia pyrifoliae TaxID=79967 RepID=A0ABY5X796_ERWPY|nr:type II secretion system F family protein [Erwinia pyrifoliae]UWS33247.1 type II secretion system F family protein [Erwinia pyrifoliae]